MTISQRYSKVISWFSDNMPEASGELRFNDPFGLLCAVILSAQCTDRRVNMVTPALLQAFPTPEKMAAASFDDVFPYIRSVSYPNSKTRHLIAMAGGLVERFSGKVPGEVEELMTLPGVGRKTANVVASIIYNKPVIAVDTHVARVSRRLGLSDGKTPETIEKDLEKHIEPSLRPRAHHWLILHGRYVCTARKPSCTTCGLSPWCRENNKRPKDA